MSPENVTTGLAFLAAGALLYSLHIARGKHDALTVTDLNGAAKRYPLIALGLSIAVLGLEVAHAHIHIVPINTVYDIDFSKPKLQLSKERFGELTDQIGAAWKKQG